MHNCIRRGLRFALSRRGERQTDASTSPSLAVIEAHPLRSHRPFGVETNRPFGVCARAPLGTTIRSIVKLGAPHPPPRNGDPAFLFVSDRSYAAGPFLCTNLETRTSLRNIRNR